MVSLLKYITSDEASEIWHDFARGGRPEMIRKYELEEGKTDLAIRWKLWKFYTKTPQYKIKRIFLLLLIKLKVIRL